MQTFLPYPDFARCAAVLDNQRLGKQRAEAIQVLAAVRAIIADTKYGWKTHPAALMWVGYEMALMEYYNAISHEWVRRGFRHEAGFFVGPREADTLYPAWLGDERLHRSHQSNLLRKDLTYYRPFFPDVPDDLPYYWPVVNSVPPDPPVGAYSRLPFAEQIDASVTSQ